VLTSFFWLIQPGNPAIVSYFWTNQKPATNLVLSHSIAAFSDDDQREIFSSLHANPRSMFIYHEPILPPKNPTERQLRPLLLQDIQANYQDRGAAGGYHLYTPSGEQAPVLVECGQWIDADSFRMVVAARPGGQSLGWLTLYDLTSKREIASTIAAPGADLARLDLEPASIDLSSETRVTVKVRGHARLPHADKLIIRLYNGQGQCVGRLPFLDEVDVTTFKMVADRSFVKGR